MEAPNERTPSLLLFAALRRARRDNDVRKI